MTKRYHFRFKRIIVSSIIILGTILIISGFIFFKYMRPRMMRLSKRFAENEVSLIIDSEVKKLMLKEFLSYDKVAVISRDASGQVTSISANSVFINNFANNLDIAIGERMDNTDLMENRIYLSSLLGLDIFVGMGPKVPVRFQPISVTRADISHSFEEAGINQTIHTVILNINVEIEVLVPFAYNTVNVNSNIPIAQTVIVGKVPDAYLNKNK